MNKWFLGIFGFFVVLSAFFVSVLEYRADYVVISTLFMIGLCIPSYYFFVKGFNKKNIPVLVLVFLSFFSMLIETVGVLTGFPYGVFNYTDKLGFFVGVIPWTVSFGWVPLVLASWFFVERFDKKLKFLHSKNKFIHVLKKALFGGLILMVFDLVLDPGSVGLNFWEWPLGGVYFGIPLSNYLGWIFSGFVGLLIVYFLIRNARFVLDKRVLFTAFFGNLFWSVVVLVKGLFIPFIFGLFIFFVVGYYLVFED